MYHFFSEERLEEVRLAENMISTLTRTYSKRHIQKQILLDTYYIKVYERYQEYSG